jgi:hypothetical protein
MYICIYRALSPLANAIIKNDPNPLLIFINKKSGGRVGSTLLECTYVYTYIFVYMSIEIHIFAHMFFISVYRNKRLYLHVYVYIHMYICIYIRT